MSKVSLSEKGYRFNMCPLFLYLNQEMYISLNITMTNKLQHENQMVDVK